MRAIGTIAATCIVVMMVGPWVVGETVSYALSDWSCGVIIWPHEMPDYVENFTLRLTEAAETAFGFWGYELPSPAEEPYDEANAFRIYDPAIDAERVIPPLQWDDREIPPVVVLDMRLESCTSLGAVSC